jgi:hypothetical protein
MTTISHMYGESCSVGFIFGTMSRTGDQRKVMMIEKVATRIIVSFVSLTRVLWWSIQYGEVGIPLSHTGAPFHGCKKRGFEAKVTTVALQAPCTNWIALPNRDICQAITTSSFYQNCRMTKNILSMDADIYTRRYTYKVTCDILWCYISNGSSLILIKCSNSLQNMNSFKCFIVINTLQTLENIFDTYLQLCEIGQHIAMKCMSTPDVVCT